MMATPTFAMWFGRMSVGSRCYFSTPCPLGSPNFDHQCSIGGLSSVSTAENLNAAALSRVYCLPHIVLGLYGVDPLDFSIGHLESRARTQVAFSWIWSTSCAVRKGLRVCICCLHGS